MMGLWRWFWVTLRMKVHFVVVNVLMYFFHARSCARQTGRILPTLLPFRVQENWTKSVFQS